MKTFTCICGNTVHFENSQCLNCGRALGFITDIGAVSALEPLDDGRHRALHPDTAGIYRLCDNYSRHNVCNWLVADDDPNVYCRSCRLNHIIPDLGEEKNRLLWYRIENAKRRLLYTLFELGLPVIGRDRDPQGGLAFEFLADPDPATEFRDNVNKYRSIMTGHRMGLITINVAEADPSAREEMREKMRELYRTLLGHFRHESGHYYWDRLIRDSAWVDEFRRLFGDETASYDQALAAYYESGPPPDWKRHYISAYAAAHPWEDWAETWAHYLHMVDTLETAHDFGFVIRGAVISPLAATLEAPAVQLAPGFPIIRPTFDALLNNWEVLTVAMNALNRSMGLPDAYPFSLSEGAIGKLKFVHRVIADTIGDH